MGVKKRIYDALHRFVVVGLVVDFIWRWRKVAYVSVALLWAYRLLFMAIVVSTAVYVSLIPVPVHAQYPGGSRDPANWYYCYSQQYNNAGADLTAPTVPWSAMTCLTLLFQPVAGGGGGFESVNMAGSVIVTGISDTVGEGARLRGFVVPARGIQDYVWSCTGGTAQCNDGVASAGSVAEGSTGSGFADNNTDWQLSAPLASSGSCASATIDVVGHFNATLYDKFWSPDTVANWTSTGSTAGTYWQAQSTTTNNHKNGSANFSCQVTSWSSWAAWLASNPEWEPGSDDLVEAEPTATPDGSGDWVMVPWDPITDTTNFPNFELGAGEDGGCQMLIPQQSVDIGGNEYGWYGFEVCRTDFALTLGMFGEDFNALINVALSLGMLGIVYSIFKRA